MKLRGLTARLSLGWPHGASVVEILLARGAGTHRPPALRAAQNGPGEIPKSPACVRGPAVVLQVRPRRIHPLARDARVGDRDADAIRYGPHAARVAVPVHPAVLAVLGDPLAGLCPLAEPVHPVVLGRLKPC